MSKRVLITGGSGYIGKQLIKYLDRHTSWIIKNYDLQEGNDIMDMVNLERTMFEFCPTVVIHLAAMSNVRQCQENMREAFVVNVKGVKNVLDSMSKVGCKNIIFASTSAVYDTSSTDGQCSILTPKRPISVYGKSKLLAEELIDSRSGISYITFRMFNVIGGHQDVGHDRLFGSLLNGNVEVYGMDYNTKDGTCIRDYVSIKDVCEAYRLAVKQIHRVYTSHLTLDICTGVGTSVGSILTLWPKSLNITIGDRREGDPEVVIGSTWEASLHLGWMARQSVCDVINSLNEND